MPKTIFVTPLLKQAYHDTGPFKTSWEYWTYILRLSKDKMEANLAALGNVRTATLLRNRKKDLLIESCVIEYALHYDHQWRK